MTGDLHVLPQFFPVGLPECPHGSWFSSRVSDLSHSCHHDLVSELMHGHFGHILFIRTSLPSQPTRKGREIKLYFLNEGGSSNIWSFLWVHVCFWDSQFAFFWVLPVCSARHSDSGEGQASAARGLSLWQEFWPWGWLSVPPGCCQSLGILKNGLSWVTSSEFPITVGIQGDIGWSAGRVPQVSIDGVGGS